MSTIDRLEADLRSAVLQYVEAEPGARETLSTNLCMPPESVERMLSSQRWDLGLSVKLADQLGVGVRVVPE